MADHLKICITGVVQHGATSDHCEIVQKDHPSSVNASSSRLMFASDTQSVGMRRWERMTNSSLELTPHLRNELS
jgi:hypothetical protein